MRWKTAKNSLRSQDQGVVTHLEYGHRLCFPTGPTSIRLVHSEDDTLLGMVALPEVDEDVKRLLKQAGLPDTGWVPGSGRFNSAHTESMLSQMLDTVRLLTLERAEVSLAQLRTAMCAVDDRLFQIHVLHLLEDAQGLVAVDEACTSVRLATWHEAMRVSQELIEQTKERHDDLEPQIQLRSHEHTLCWIALSQTDETYHVHQMVEPYARLEGGDGEAVERFLQEQHISFAGWAATYGIERASLEPRNPEKEERQRLEWLAEMDAFCENAQYTLVSPTVIGISFLDDPDGKNLHQMDLLMKFGYQAYTIQLNGTMPGGELPSLHFGFEDPQNLERARSVLKLPVTLQAGPKTSTRIQPVKRWTLKTLLFGSERS